MVIVAHPDDAEFTVAGSVARWVAEGHDVIYVICTDGSRGSNNPQMSPEQMALVRQQEQREAARILGLKDVVFLGYADGTLQATLELRRDITREIRRYKPDLVVCGDPRVRIYNSTYLNHPDHRAAADAALDAVFPSAETRFVFPELLGEGLEPHKVKEVYLSGALEPDTWIDITDFIDQKIAALKAHKSQVGEGAWVEEMIRGWNSATAQGHGMAYAEAFKRIELE